MKNIIQSSEETETSSTEQGGHQKENSLIHLSRKLTVALQEKKTEQYQIYDFCIQLLLLRHEHENTCIYEIKYGFADKNKQHT